MKRFLTLIWLEHRRNWIWSLPLIWSLLFWAWGIKQVTVMDVGERLGIRAGLLMAAASIGTVVLCIMCDRAHPIGDTQRAIPGAADEPAVRLHAYPSSIRLCRRRGVCLLHHHRLDVLVDLRIGGHSI